MLIILRNLFLVPNLENVSIRRNELIKLDGRIDSYQIILYCLNIDLVVQVQTDPTFLAQAILL